MPVQTSYPGVYVQEVPSGVRTIVGVTTSVTAFVGVARQGPVDQPVRVRSMAEYVRSFGPPLEETRPMGHAVGQFFVNGGSEAVVVRVVGAGAARAEVTLRTVGSSPIDLFRLQAKGAGAWANKVGGAGMEASVDYASTSNPADLFSLVIRLLGPDPRSGESVVLAEEVFQDLSAAPAHPRFAPTVLLGSALVDVVVPDPPPTSAAQASSTGIQLAEGNLELGAANGVLRLAVNHAPPMDLVIAAASTPTSVPKPGIVRAINEAAAAAGLPVAAGGAANRFVLTTNTPGGGADTSVVVGVAPANDASQVLGLGRAWGGEEKSGAAALRPAQTPGNPLRFTGGADAAVTPEDIAPASGRGGIYALGVLDFPRFNLLCLPDLPASDPTAPATAANSTKLSAALAFCKAERAFLIVDTPKDWPITPTPNVGGLAALGEHGALYYPRVTVAEQGPGGLPRLVDLPASGAIAGVMARTDAARGIWKAPAWRRASRGFRGFRRTPMTASPAP